MSINLSKRIFTSLLLSIILIIGLFLNKFIFLYSLIVVSIISCQEFYNLIKKIFKNQKSKIYLFNTLSVIYLGIFTTISYIFYDISFEKFAFALLVCIFSDTGGYLIGNLVGGRKLTKLSPKKTISGCIGSFIFSLIPIAIYWFILENSYTLKDNSLIELIFVCMFLSLICQIGDLYISYFKRRAGVKDTGTILPGHGGLLDRIDGLIFVLPVAFILNKIFVL